VLLHYVQYADMQLSPLSEFSLHGFRRAFTLLFMWYTSRSNPVINLTCYSRNTGSPKHNLLYQLIHFAYVDRLATFSPKNNPRNYTALCF